MHRFFFPNADLTQSTLEVVSATEIHHLHNVLRLKKGDKITLFNGQGQEACGTILEVTPQRLSVQLNELNQVAPKDHTLTLACAIPKKAKFEMIIEKATELGADEIIPLVTQRTEVRISADNRVRKTARYQKVAVNAAKQCQRSTIPDVRQPLNYLQLLKAIGTDTLAVIACFHPASQNLIEVMKENQPRPKILFLVGPEGDFTRHEVDLALAAGCRPANLGPTVLKVDTAALTMLAAANLLLNRMYHLPS